MTDLLDMLRDVPPELAAAWGGWTAVGLMLLLWHMRARVWEREYARQRFVARHPRPMPSSGVRRPTRTEAVDAFGELEALLDTAPNTGTISRRPGD